jgi:hypothetical protein
MQAACDRAVRTVASFLPWEGEGVPAAITCRERAEVPTLYTHDTGTLYADRITRYIVYDWFNDMITYVTLHATNPMIGTGD